MSRAQALGCQSCSLLAVLCGQYVDRPRSSEAACRQRPAYRFPELPSSGRLEVQTLVNPTIEQFCEIQKSLHPSIVYLQGERLENEERIGSLVWGDEDVSEPEMLASLIRPPLPTIVYIEVPHAEKIAQAFHSKGVPYIIYWRNTFSSFAASHFRHALLSVLQSSSSHTWDAFQLAHASFRLYCVRNNQVSQDNSQKISLKLGPHLLGDPPKINIPTPEKNMGEKDEEDLPQGLPAVNFFDEEVDMRFLICGVPCTLDACLLGSLEDGLNALLNIEIRGSKLQNRVSAAPPPNQAANFSRGVLTMRCDITTCSVAHISLLVSASAQNCFDNKLLESHIKNELIEKSQLVHALPNGDDDKPSSLYPLNSVSIACGSSVIEVCMRAPAWAAQVLKHLAPDVSYRSFVALGITNIQGTPVASFEKEDADRLLFFCRRQDRDFAIGDFSLSCPPRLHSSLTKHTTKGALESNLLSPCNKAGENGLSCRSVDQNTKAGKRLKSDLPVPAYGRQKPRVSAMRPIPHSRKNKMLPFSGVSLTDANDKRQMQIKVSIMPPVKHSVVPHFTKPPKKSTSNSLRAQKMIPLNPLPMKKHECNRAPIQLCPEEDFLKDVMQFLTVKGHSRLVPQGGISEFPDAILNAKRLDLYNLYREVVSRGGFYVGNGINWKGQVFSKMRNHTATNRMTGVGNTLKRHYETYLLEYELAHDDVDGECCLLCHSSAPGDWVNCGLCGEWAHFGCDRRQGLGTFKDYAKTDGLEYICPHCSLSNCKKIQKVANGFSKRGATTSRHM